MAAACEISNVFSTYFSAMYSPEEPAAPAPPAPPAAPAFGADDPLSLGSPPVPPEGPGGFRGGLRRGSPEVGHEDRAPLLGGSRGGGGARAQGVPEGAPRGDESRAGSGGSAQR